MLCYAYSVALNYKVLKKVAEVNIEKFSGSIDAESAVVIQ